MPSQSIERIWTRLARGSLFMPHYMNFLLSVKHFCSASDDAQPGPRDSECFLNLYGQPPKQRRKLGD